MRGIRYLIHDRDSKFTAQFKAILEEAGVKVIPICYHAPNMNAICERWVPSVKTECINRIILVGEESLRRALLEFCNHYIKIARTRVWTTS